jgi:hypothetical protein
MIDHTIRVPVTPGTPVLVELPYSEACMHARVAGKWRWIVLDEHGGAAILDASAQSIPTPDGTRFGGFTPGEVGIYRDEHDAPYTYGLTRCATMGCDHHAAGILTWHDINAVKSQGTIVEPVCEDCAQSYLRRPSLRARFRRY